MESPLQRFIRTDGAAMVGLAPGGQSPKELRKIGIGSLLLSAVVGLGAIYWADEPVIFCAVATPLLAMGGFNLAFSALFQSRIPRDPYRADLSASARAFLEPLVQRTLHPRWSTFLRAGVPEPTAADLEALERAAVARERIRERATGDDIARCCIAADAGMAEAIHLVATGGTASPEMITTLGRLEEMAELLAERPPFPASPTSDFNRLETVLEDLRGERAARQELNG